ncbi:MAG TPA: hypothetical protein VFO67_12085 [Gemmatimonadales bacterium]|nr:hypothetical protein [Gemmatimonadales bacterium]
MPSIHCHICGGFIGNPSGTTFRTPNAATPLAIPHSALCVCDHPVVFGTPEVERVLHGVHHIRSAARN